MFLVMRYWSHPGKDTLLLAEDADLLAEVGVGDDAVG